MAEEMKIPHPQTIPLNRIKFLAGPTESTANMGMTQKVSIRKNSFFDEERDVGQENNTSGQ